MKENRVLTIDNLTTTFESHKQKIQAVRGVSLHVDEGDILAIVGESGSGKSVTMKSVMGLLGENADVQADHLELLQKDLLSMSEKEKRKMRGKDMAMIFQDPMTALNPLKKIGYHMIEVLRRHQNLSKAEARKVAIDMLGKVGIPSAESRMALELTRPYACMTTMFFLLFAYALVMVLLIFWFRILWNELAGMIAGVVFNGISFIFSPGILQKLLGISERKSYLANVAAGWISPLSHATYHLHNFGYDRLPSLRDSGIYDMVLVIMLILLNLYSIRTYHFVFDGTGER